MKKVFLLCLIFIFCVVGYAIRPSSTEINSKNTSNENNNTNAQASDELCDTKVTIENFADNYYRNLLDETLLGKWTQQDVTFFLERCVQEDIDKNKEQSSLFFIKNNKVPFLYLVNTSTGMDIVHFLIEKEGEQRRFPHFEFISLSVRIIYDGDNYEDVDTYDFEVFNKENVEFDNVNDFINYMNDKCTSAVFWGRGWLD